MRGAVRSIDPDQPVYAISTLEDRFAADPFPCRLAAMALTALAAVALGLASIGTYGVMSHTVNEHAHEIGRRMALGAKGSTLLAWITGQALVQVATGIVLGLAGAFAATRAMGSLLYNVRPMDPATLTAVVLVLGGGWSLRRLSPRLAGDPSRPGGDAAGILAPSRSVHLR